MYKSIMIAAWTALILFVVTALAAEQSASQVWVVSNTFGSVSVNLQGKDETALTGVKVGDRLRTPFAVKTGDTGNLTVTHGDDRVSIGPNAHLVFPAKRQASAGNTVHIDQRLGSVLYKVEHRKKDTFSVETPYLVSVVKGTVFTITTSVEDTTVALMQGSLQVTTPDKQHELLLEPGQVAVKSRTGERILLLDEHKLSAPEEGPVTLDQHNGKSQTAVDIRALSMTGNTATQFTGDLSTDTSKLSSSGGELTSDVGDLVGTTTADLTSTVVDLTGTTTGVLTTATVDLAGTTTGNLTSTVSDLTNTTTVDLTSGVSDLTNTTTVDLTSMVSDLTNTTTVDLTSMVTDLTGTTTVDLTSTVTDLTNTTTDALANTVNDVANQDATVINTITQGLLK